MGAIRAITAVTVLSIRILSSISISSNLDYFIFNYFNIMKQYIGTKKYVKNPEIDENNPKSDTILSKNKANISVSDTNAILIKIAIL